MKRVCKSLFFGLALLGSLLTSVVAPNNSYAAACTVNGRFLNLPMWYEGLEGEDNGHGGCSLTTPKDENAFRAYVWTVALNIASIVFGVAGYLAVIFVMIGGVRYMTSQGSPQAAAGAKKTIANALIGVVLCALASTLANVFNNILVGARDSSDFFVSIANTILSWAGIIAVIMIIIGGINYVTSTGNPTQVAKAKNTLLYAIVGLIITILAAAIVNTVLGAL